MVLTRAFHLVVAEVMNNEILVGVENFIDEITLGNASNQEIKRYIRKQARLINNLVTKLEMIKLREKEKRLNRKRASLRRFMRYEDL